MTSINRTSTNPTSINLTSIRRPRRGRMLTAVLAAGALVVAACGSDDNDVDTTDAPAVTDAPAAPEPGDPAAPDASDISVAVVLNGELGDEAFFDSANRGAQRAIDELGISVRVIEAGLDPAGWEPALRSAVASGDYDLIITGTFPMADVLEPVSQEFPDQQFVFYDAELAGDNIHSILYSQNEASYLAGIVAAATSGSGELDGLNEGVTLGFVGGRDLPAINDVRVGFEKGAQAGDENDEVIVAYAGGFGDPGQGRELAEAQIDQGADVVFQVAGGTGFGVFEAAGARGVYAIGVDSNQNPLAPGTILTSVMKNVDNSLFQAMERFVAGDLAFGVTEVLGLAEDGVGLAQDEFSDDLVPADVQAMVDDARAAIIAGEIQVDSTLG
ncbi:BMP family ABC transporter substrate-binding protein [soil metagenome]